MQKRDHELTTVFHPYHSKASSAVEHRRRCIVALLHQYPQGLTAREIREVLGFSKDLAASALSGLFVRGVLHKRGHSYVLAASAEALEPSSQR